MFRRSILHFSLLAAGLGLVISSLSLAAQDTDKRGRKYKAPPQTARIEVTILRDFNGKPIENAAVVFHPMAGEHDKGNMELKTNEDGKTVIDVLPIGDTVRMQVIAKGFQTYGQDYKVDKPEMTIEIKLKRPGEQYSIYKNHDQAANAQKDADSNAPKDGNASPDALPAAGKDAAKGAGNGDAAKGDAAKGDAAKDKPAGSSAQPSQNPPQPN